LGAAFWVYGTLPAWIEVLPGRFEPSGRNGIWLLPLVHLCLAVGLYGLMAKMGKTAAEQAEARGKETDLLQKLPWIRLFLFVWLSGICLAVIYSYHMLDIGGSVMFSLIGRVSALVMGAGVAIWALGLSDATHKNVLTLRFSYTERSFQVWLRVHKTGARVLYVAGAILIVAAFLLSGLWALVTAFVTLLSALAGLYLYAKYLYESEF